MKRRDMVKTITLLSAGISWLPGTGFSAKNDFKPLCLEYLDRIVKMFRKIRNLESDTLLEASYHIARTYKNGGNCFCQWETGHSFDGDMFPDRHGDTDIFTLGYTMGSPSRERFEKPP